MNTTLLYIDVVDGAPILPCQKIPSDEVEIHPINYSSKLVLGKSDIKIEEHVVYLYNNNAYTPVLLEYINKDNGHYTYQEVVCTNLYTGKSLDYSLINGV